MKEEWEKGMWQPTKSEYYVTSFTSFTRAKNSNVETIKCIINEYLRIYLFETLTHISIWNHFLYVVDALK
jgi:hypothetical protein